MKIYYYFVLSVMLMALFYVAGFNLATSSWVFERLGILNLENYQSASFWILMISIFTLSTGVGVLIGTFTNTSPTYVIKSMVIMPTLAILISDTIQILLKLKSFGETWVFWIAFVLITPLAFGYVIALIEFWEGRD